MVDTGDERARDEGEREDQECRALGCLGTSRHESKGDEHPAQLETEHDAAREGKQRLADPVMKSEADRETDRSGDRQTPGSERHVAENAAADDRSRGSRQAPQSIDEAFVQVFCDSDCRPDTAEENCGGHESGNDEST